MPERPEDDPKPVPASDSPPLAPDDAEDEPESLLTEGTGKRPTIVYVALAAGALVLIALLLIVWLSARDDDRPDSILCLDLSLAEAEHLILNGNIRQIDVLVASEQPLEGLTAIQLYLEDGQCRMLPEGADNRPGLYQALGQVTFFNEASDEGDIQINYIFGSVPTSLLHTSTPVTTPTPVMTPTPATPAAAVMSPTETATPTAEPSPPPATPSPEQGTPSPVASPEE
jgi:hypothetical protein